MRALIVGTNKCVAMKEERERERLTINREKWGDYTSKGPWKLNRQTYSYVMKERTDGDGEWWRVIVKRKSDGKHFEFQWGYSENTSRYLYEDDLVEVFPKVITTTIYE